MAEVMKSRSLVNPGRRRFAKRRRARVGNPPKKRRMSPKQIAIFGTPRQKAALRASRGRKRRTNAGLRSIRKSKKRARKLGVKRFGSLKAARKFRRKNTSRARRRVARHKNVGQIFSIGLGALNPGRKRRRKSVMAKRRRRARRAVSNPRRRRVYTRRRRRSSSRMHNPYPTRRRRYSRRRKHAVARRGRRRNAGGVGSTVGLFGSALSVIGGAVATRALTQVALGSNNSGVFGYVGNAIAAMAVGFVASKVPMFRAHAKLITVGGFTGLALRLLSDLTPIGQYVNLQLSGIGRGGDAGIGLITDSYFTTPPVWQTGSMTQAQIPSQIQAMIAAGGSKRAGMAGVGRRYARAM